MFIFNFLKEDLSLFFFFKVYYFIVGGMLAVSKEREMLDKEEKDIRVPTLVQCCVLHMYSHFNPNSMRHFPILHLAIAL